MPTFGDWEMTVLDHAYNYVDYLSLHSYYGNYRGTADYLARPEEMDRFIKGAVAICDAIKAKKHSEKTIHLSFDEWNVWFRTRDDEKRIEKWQKAPKLLEEIYNFEDALLVGCLLMTMQNNCDRVKMACLAQLVNVIAPIMTENDGKAWKQTIFYPYMYASLYGNGTTLRTMNESDTYKSSEGYDIPYLYTSVIDNKDKNELVIFAANRSLSDDMKLNIAFDDIDATLIEHIELYSDDLNAVNDKDAEQVIPATRTLDASDIILKKHSWNMIRFKY
jgi:alpha-N-arabinofuranosidase